MCAISKLLWPHLIFMFNIVFSAQLIAPKVTYISHTVSFFMIPAKIEIWDGFKPSQLAVLKCLQFFLITYFHIFMNKTNSKYICLFTFVLLINIKVRKLLSFALKCLFWVKIGKYSICIFGCKPNTLSSEECLLILC